MKFSSVFFSTILCAFTVLAWKPISKIRDGNETSHIAREAAYVPPGWPFKPAPRKPGFLSKKTAEFEVNGAGLPDVPFHIGVSYSGLMPTINTKIFKKQKLFFWFFPSTDLSAPQEIIIWLNGGPGCSSLAGLLTENGPFTWMPGTTAPKHNPYSWTNLTNVLYVEQPVSVGYTQGKPLIEDEKDLATEFRGFYQNFEEKFDVKGWKVYLTGQGYAGMYIPYIASELISGGYDEDNPQDHINVRGVLINNPVIGESTMQRQVPFLDYVERSKHLLDIDELTMVDIRRQAKKCGYTDYWDKYFKFPAPPGFFPELPIPEEDCYIQDDTIARLTQRNPCLNPQHITDTCPKPEKPYQDMENYFNRRDVRRHLHAPSSPKWVMCKDSVFNTDSGEDPSIPPTLNDIMTRVISHTDNVMLGSGDLDMIIPTNGTLLAIQNFKWGSANPHPGFMEYPRNELFVPQLAGAELDENNGKTGVQGKWGRERGLTFYSAENAGAMLPADAPGLAFRALEVLLGRIPDLGSREGFTTPKELEIPERE